MHRLVSTVILLFFLGGISCGGDDGAPASADATKDADATFVDALVRDAVADLGDAVDAGSDGAPDTDGEVEASEVEADVARDSGCDVICWWDCPYAPPYRCVGGVVWARFSGGEPCHCPGDPWPYPGPWCTERLRRGRSSSERHGAGVLDELLRTRGWWMKRAWL